MASVSGPPLVYGLVFYPAGSTPGEALPITIAAGEERHIDIHLRFTPAFRVSGALLGPRAAFVDMTLARTTGEALPDTFDFGVYSVNDDGAFVLPIVPAGEYLLRVISYPSIGFPMPPPISWATAALTVASDVSGLRIPLRAAHEVRGQVQWESSTGQEPAIGFAGVSIVADPVRGNSRRSGVNTDGRFAIPSLVPGRYWMRATAVGWQLKSATSAGRDVVDHPLNVDDDVTDLVVTFTDRATQIVGRVTGLSESPQASIGVIAFPTDRSLWTGLGFFTRRIVVTAAAPDGAFSFPHLPPGDYFIAAIRDEEASPWRLLAPLTIAEEGGIPPEPHGDWRNPLFLAAVARVASRISLEEGDRTAISLPPQSIR